MNALTTMLISITSTYCVANGESGAESKIAQLERQNAVLRESYALARQDASDARSELREIRERLDALGGAALGQGEARLIETVAQLEATRADYETLRKIALNLSNTVAAYSQGALVEDANASLELEAALRELEVGLGYRTAPQNALAGNLNHSTVVSIDAESGLLVINAGQEAKIKVGMPMEIARGDQAIAYAVVTDVRKKVAGMLVQKRLSNSLDVKVGDSVSVKTID